MAAADQLSHQVAGEAPLGTRVSQQGVQWSWVGENVGQWFALDPAGAARIEQLMLESPAHRQNILTGTGTMVGVDVVVDPTHNTLWLTEDFAN
jgi:uncharacterized protein YkwD